MIENYLYEQNLHWQGKTYEAGTERSLLKSIVPLLELDHILAISGVRRCGKSFLMKQLVNQLMNSGIKPENILFVNLELPAFFGKPAAQVLDELWNNYSKIKDPPGKIYIFFDEVQTLPGWETWIKYHYDQRKGQIKFIITGSNSQLLSSEFASLLSGRVIEKKLYPFSFAEILRHRNIDFSDGQARSLSQNRIMNIFDNYLLEGGMPELLTVSTRELKREVITSYFNTVIYKDIAPRFSVRHLGLLKDLAVYFCGQASALVNLKKMAELFESNRTTIKEFTQYLQLSFLLLMLEKFDYSAKRRELALKKVYLIDNGFAVFLPLRFSPDRGNLLENLVCIELSRRYGNIFYWKNHGECDFIISEGSSATKAFQVCYQLNENNLARELAGLKAVCDSMNITDCDVITYDQKKQIDHKGLNVTVVPAYEWFLEGE